MSALENIECRLLYTFCSCTGCWHACSNPSKKFISPFGCVSESWLLSRWNISHRWRLWTFVNILIPGKINRNKTIITKLVSLVFKKLAKTLFSNHQLNKTYVQGVTFKIKLKIIGKSYQIQLATFQTALTWRTEKSEYNR